MAETINYLDIDLADTMIPKYLPYINNKSRYLGFIGSRGSGKSMGAGEIILIRMMTHKFFRGVGIRKYANLIKDSIFQTLLDIISMWGLEDYFKVNKATFRLECLLNGNTFINRGLDEPKGLKSLREATFVFFEEELPETLEDFNTIDLSIRTQQADFIQIMFALNPAFEGAPEEHWWYKLMGYEYETSMTFDRIKTGVIDEKEVKLSISSMHTTYKDNPFLTPEYKFKLESETDPYLRAVNTLGIWARKTIDGRFYKSFDLSKNVGYINERGISCDYSYDRDKAIYMAIDFNQWPYCAIVVFQIYGKKLVQIDEVCVNDNVESSITAALKEFKKRYNNHYLDVIVCGDATGKKGDATHEKGFNNYNIVKNELAGMKLVMRVPSANPSVEARGGFTNEVFLQGYNDIEFVIHSKCNQTINDFLYLKVKEDNTIKKEILKDKERGISYERFGHTSDCCTYLLCEIFKDDFLKWQDPHSKFDPIYIPRNYKNRL